MKPALLRKYWATWRDVRAAYIAQGMPPTQADAMRDELCIKAHGQPLSATVMTDDQAGDVLKEFALILHPDSIDHQLQDNSTAARKRRQCIWSIKKEEPRPGYAASLSQDIHHRRDWENLPYDDLLQLRRRIGNDARGYTIPGGNTRRRPRSSTGHHTPGHGFDEAENPF